MGKLKGMRVGGGTWYRPCSTCDAYTGLVRRTHLSGADLAENYIIFIFFILLPFFIFFIFYIFFSTCDAYTGLGGGHI